MHAEHPQVRVGLSHRAGGSRDLAADVVADRLELALATPRGRRSAAARALVAIIAEVLASRQILAAAAGSVHGGHR